MELTHFFIYFFGIIFFIMAILLAFYSQQYARIMCYSKDSHHKIAFSWLVLLAGMNTSLDIFFVHSNCLHEGTILLWTVAFLMLIYVTVSSITAIRKSYPGLFLKIVLRAPGSIYNLAGISMFAIYIIFIYFLKISDLGISTFTWHNIIGYAILTSSIACLVMAIKAGICSNYTMTIEDEHADAVFNRNDVLIARAYGSLINRFLEKANPLLNITRERVAEYFENNPILFQNCTMRQNGTINFDALIINIDRLGNENRIHQICLLFSGLSSKLLELYSAITSREHAESLLAESYRTTIKLYKHPSLLLEILRSLPDCMMDEEKLALMSKDELEIRVRERTRELEKARDYQESLLQDLKISERNLRHVITNNVDSIIIVSRSGIVRFANPASESLFGRNASEFVGQPFGIHIQPHEVREFEITHENGEKLTAEMHAVELEWKNERAYLASVRNITHRIQLEDKLRRAEKMEAIGTLAGGVAHDLNNILGGIVSYPDLILMDLPENSPLIEPILTIQESGKRAVYVIQDLLTLARRGVIVNDVVNLNQIILNYLESPEYQKTVLYHLDVEIKTDLETDPLCILGSEAHLSKTVMNLVSNAVEAMPKGGNLLITTENRYIDRPVSGYDQVKEGDYVALTVSDSGIGISSEDIGKIFEPFYTKKKMGRSGTGLGMAVVWGTVKDHKGYIDIQSIEGKGTTFTLYFPITRQEPSEQKFKVPIESYRASGESVLVVDDVKEQREIAFKILSELGYSVKSVGSGEAAIQYLRNHAVDLIVLDMIMDPGIDGLDTYKQIVELYPGQKAVITSGFSVTERVNSIKELGGGQYIKKPYTLEKLGVAVKNELME